MRYFEKQAETKEEKGVKFAPSVVVPGAVGTAAGGMAGAYAGFKSKPYMQAADVGLDYMTGKAGQGVSEVVKSIFSIFSKTKIPLESKTPKELIGLGKTIRTDSEIVKELLPKINNELEPEITSLDSRLKGISPKLRSLAETVLTKESPLTHLTRPGALALKNALRFGAAGAGLGAVYYGAKKITE